VATPLIILSAVGLAMAVLLSIGRKLFPVEVDARREKITDILPGANCGGCGYPGCSGYAAALVEGEASPTQCPPGGAEVAEQIAAILGVEVGETVDRVALVRCAGSSEAAPARARYLGIADCAAAHAVAGGAKTCPHGCLGLGSCEEACPFGAIEMVRGVAVVIKGLCTGCGQCVEVCPRGIIAMVPRAASVHVLCVSPEKSKAVRAACSVGCTGCKICAKQSPAFSVDGTLAAVDYESGEEIPEHAALACPQGTILDERRFGALRWIDDPSARADHEARTEEWKAKEKARKAAARKAKAAAGGKKGEGA